MAEIKEKIIQAIRGLPDSATYDDIYEIIFVQEKINKGLEDSKNNRTITQKEFEEKYKARLEPK